MLDDVEELTGGNTAELVVRMESTVRKPATRATPAVHAALAHLRGAGFNGAPTAFGLDEAGRQVLEFVPGPMWDRTRPHTPADLRRVGALIRALHDVVSSFQYLDVLPWDTLTEPDGEELLCHNDLAPWNLVCGADRWVFIDWDCAAPGTRLWDLAWAAMTFPPVEPGCDLATAAEAISALIAGYGLDRSSYRKLIDLMARRAKAESDLLVEGARTGRQPWARLHAEGHDHYWGPVAAYILHNAGLLESMLEP